MCEGIDGRRTVPRGPRDPGRIGNLPNAGGITRDLVDLLQIADEAESIEDREKVVGNVRNHHSCTGIFLIPREHLVERSGQVRGSMKLVYYVSITRLE